MRVALEVTFEASHDVAFKEHVKIGLVSLDSFIEDAEATRRNDEMLEARRFLEEMDRRE